MFDRNFSIIAHIGINADKVVEFQALIDFVISDHGKSTLADRYARSIYLIASG